MNWHNLKSTEDVDLIISTVSHEKTCVIFKHSTTCSISSIAKHRLQSDWTEDLDSTAFYYLDLLQYRAVSNYIAEHLNVHHESPQIIVIKKGISDYDVSHLDISIADLLTEI